MSAMTVDFGRTAADYAAYRAGFPDALFSRLETMEVGVAGQRVLDLGTGTGALARGFARAGCHVTGVDVAPALLEEARRLDAQAGLHVSYRVGRAEDTGLAAGTFDLVTAGQCWHWFDRPRAATEAHRLLRPGGAIAICHFDYLVLPGNVCAATEELILKYNPTWTMAGGTGMHPAWSVDLACADFVELETFSFDVDVPYTHESWRGRMRTCNGIGASLSDTLVVEFDRSLARMLAERFPNQTLRVPHRVWALTARVL